MGIAAEAAPEIDRLVLSVGRVVNEKHGAALLAQARDCGLDSLLLLPHFGDFLLAGQLTRDLALIRMRYWPPDRVSERLRELEDKDLVRQEDGRLVATTAFQPLLEALAAAQADVAGAMWSAHQTEVATSTAVSWVLARAASDDHLVAVVHRDLPEAADPYGRLERRLVTLRYIRQHDHAMAWQDRGLSAAQMVVMTSLWNDESAESSPEVTDSLRAAGYVTDEPLQLSDEGLRVRREIEEETNRRAQQTFDVLDEADAVEFVSALRRLPDAAT